MSNEYISTEVAKIVNDEQYPFPKNLAMASAWILANSKGVNLKVINVSKSSSIADYFILASANNPTQARSMADDLLFQIKKHGQEVLSKEGLADAQWILLDFGDIIVHIFQELTRDIYDLDTLWSESPHEQIPNEYYYGPQANSETDSDKDSENYF